MKVYLPPPVCQEIPDGNKAVDKMPAEDYFKLRLTYLGG